MYYSSKLTHKQCSFLEVNWYSLDSVEILFEENKINIYEIKTMNKYRSNLKYKPKMTASSYEIYSQAKELGFNVKLAFVILKDDWEYDVVIDKLSRDKLYIDKPKRYDNPRGALS